VEEYKVNEFKNTNCIEEINIVFEEKIETFAKEVKAEISRARNQHRRIEYFSDNIIIHSYSRNINLGQDVLIFEMVYRNKKENNVEYSYIANKTIYGSHLLSLINRGEMSIK